MFSVAALGEPTPTCVMNSTCPPRCWINGIASRRLVGAWLACALISSCSAMRSPAPDPLPAARPNPAKASPNAADSLRGTDGQVIQAVLESHNAERARRKLSPLVLDPELTAAAQAHADDMARRGKMAHRGGDGSSPFDRMKRAGYSFQAAGENVAYGFDRVDAVMAGWMKSPGHRRNILGDYTQLGVGRAIAPGDVSYWCVTFGTPMDRDFR